MAPLIITAPFSSIMVVGALVPVEVTAGITMMGATFDQPMPGEAA